MEQAVLHKWEYVVEELHGVDALRSTLARLGAEGWELMHLARDGSGEAAVPVKTLRARRSSDFCAVFKRPQL